jgi:hypothetical protein
MFHERLPAQFRDAARFTIMVDNEAGEHITVTMGCNAVELEGRDCIIPHLRPENFVQLLMYNLYKARAGFIENNQYVCGESVMLSPDLLTRLYDPLKLYSSYVPIEQKAAQLAVFTQTFNEGDMLLYWEAYYAKMVGHENLYVLNNGSTDGSCERLHPKTNVINMPVAPVDHERFAQLQGHFQRFLLMRYEWVIKVDTDEFLVCDGDMVETLKAQPGGTYHPEHAVEVLHDWKTEPPFDFAKPVFAQRTHVIRGTKLLLRPIISSIATTWSAGNHTNAEQSTPLRNSYVLHLKYFDINYLYRKNDKWSRMAQTETEARVCKQITALSELSADKMGEFSGEEIALRLAEPALPIPAWVREKL